MEKKQIICTVCPRGCEICITGENKVIKSIEGFSCNRGKVFAETEFVNPKRIFTSSAKVDGAEEPLVPVRSSEPIPKEKLFDCVKEVNKVVLTPPVKKHDVVIKNVLGLGCDIIACRDAN